jgi:hypothetical protein
MLAKEQQNKHFRFTRDLIIWTDGHQQLTVRIWRGREGEEEDSRGGAIGQRHVHEASVTGTRNQVRARSRKK